MPATFTEVPALSIKSPELIETIVLKILSLTQDSDIL